MKKLYVQSLPLRDVVRDLAKEMNTGVREDCNEIVLDLPEEYGTGFIRGMDFRSGIALIDYSCTFNFDVHIYFNLGQVHPLKFLFCSEGNITHYFQERDRPNKISTYQNAIVASSAQNGHVIAFEKGQTTRMNSLEINRTAFCEAYLCSLEKFNSPLKTLLKDKKAAKLFNHQGSYSLKTAEVIKEMNADDFSNFVRDMRLNAGAYRILAAQIDQYEDDLKNVPERSLIRQKELDTVKQLRDKIAANLSTVSTVKELAEEIGMNSNKLQLSFKHLYHTTVNQHIQELRLQETKKLLRETELTMLEITEKVGLSNPSYFSKTFKEEFDLTPKQYRDRFPKN